MSTFVSLLEVLESRGTPLEEEEVWAILLFAAEALMTLSSKGSGNVCSIISPSNVLLSLSGDVAFKANSHAHDVASFTPPEVPRNSSGKEKMLVYSLGLTLYWTLDYRLSQNQPVQLSDHLNNVLLSMCEEEAHRRPDLLFLLDVCEQHQKTTVPPPPDKLISRMVRDVLQDPAKSTMGDSALLTNRSQLVRDKLRGICGQNPSWSLNKSSSPSYTLQTESNSPCRYHHRGSTSSSYYEGHMFLSDGPNRSLGSSNVGPEFVRMLAEPFIVLEMPSSNVSKKGKSCSTQRDVKVVMPNGQNILVKCDAKTRGGDVFDMITAHSELVEHFYFGLAYTYANEFFFLPNETKISKVAPESWKKAPTSMFVLHFRIKFFVSDVTLLLHRLSRHQYYQQLRRDILEDRLPCNEETGLLLAALALQAEFGDIIPEVYGRDYYQPEHYVPRSILEKIALPCLKKKLRQLHGINANMTAEESELEFIKVVQQLSEYGLLFHRAASQKKPSVGELLLGVCAKGIVVHEYINNVHTSRFRFHWQEIVRISAAKRKFVIESSAGVRKHTFLMEKSRIAKYLCSLCMEQHKFHKEMSSRQLSHSLASVASKTRPDACRRISCSDGTLSDGGRDVAHHDSMSKLCDHIANRIESRIKQQTDLLERSCALSPVSPRFAGSHKQSSEVPSSSSFLRDTPTNSRAPEREIIHVTLKKDPKLGLGIIIVGEDSTNGLDLGIFIASVVPGGPADQDGRIRQGGRLISLNQTSLEGVSFSEAAEIIQRSPSQVELIISQSEALKKPINPGGLAGRKYDSQTTIGLDSCSEDGLDELVTMMMTPKLSRRLQVPEVHISSVQLLSLQKEVVKNCVGVR